MMEAYTTYAMEKLALEASRGTAYASADSIYELAITAADETWNATSVTAIESYKASTSGLICLYNEATGTIDIGGNISYNYL